MTDNNKLTNESKDLKPHAEMREPILNFDFPGIKIGIAQYPEGPTGCTVIKFDPTDNKPHRGARHYADIRGGSPAVRGYEVGWADAICLAGGSFLGLDSVDGVALELFAENDFIIDWGSVPVVPGAIVWDFHIRGNTLYPDKRLGRLAAQNMFEGKFPMGRQGAGSSVRVGGGVLGRSINAHRDNLGIFEISGQGAQYTEIKGVKIFACVILNAVGAIRDKSGEIVKGHFNRNTNQRVSMIEQVEFYQNWMKENPPPEKKVSQNTTLTVVVTNQSLNSRELKQVARQVHSSMAKMIDPFHTINDGDVLFFVTTDEVDASTLPVSSLGYFATDVVWDAVLNCFE
ncbi:MAG: peptidase S58, DmpA [Candidatus Heimdallarchaeota archaeon]|nr:peptidase S58, DmpA [Candidatus Heimdallarchaeota archaeon]